MKSSNIIFLFSFLIVISLNIQAIASTHNSPANSTNKEEVMTKKIVIYTKDLCPYCIRAKHLLKAKNVEFEEIDTTGNDELRMKLVEMSGGRKTVPQIFIDGECYGGFDDINKLDQEGKLDQILGL